MKIFDVVWIKQVITTCFLFLLLPILCSSIYSLQTFHGVVGAGNYSYYRLTLEGNVVLTLTTIEGDADIYVSEHTLQPTFDPENHCMTSVTCGIDSVHIASEFKRPVGIGIYGHPSHEVSSYQLQVMLDSDATRSYSAEEDSLNINKIENLMPPTGDDEDKSILWTIFVGILKVLLEVLAS